MATTRTWDDELRDALVARHGPMQGACWRPSGARASRATTRPRLRRRWPFTDIGYTTPRDARRAVRGRAPERVRRPRRAHARRALQERRQGRAVGGDADARGPRPARDRGGPDAAAGRRQGHLGAGLRGPGPGRQADRPRSPWRARRGLPSSAVRRGDASPTRSTGWCSSRGSTGADRDPPRLPQVPPAHRLALRQLQRRAGRERGDHPGPRGAVRAALRPRARARRGRGGGTAGADRAGAGRRRAGRKHGPTSLGAVFEGRDQLVVYKHMFHTGRPFEDQCEESPRAVERRQGAPT